MPVSQRHEMWQEEEMDRFKTVAFFDEFAFLTRDFDGKGAIVGNTDDVEEVAVKRISWEFLSVKPRYQGATGSMVDIDDSERIFLLDANGRPLLEVQQDRDIHHNEAHWDDEFQQGETVGESLLHLDSPDQIVYGVCVHTGYKVVNHHSVGGYSVTLYKPPKDFSLKGWVDEQLRRALRRINADVAEIDAEA